MERDSVVEYNGKGGNNIQKTPSLLPTMTLKSVVRFSDSFGF